ncbi:probable phenylalanine--tRNA ligase, mitochondrial [Diabrotica virgifera virgifera]|uniref:phenylalanine--tRNA ligase n=1 Tax=Diabrotica virgifera virgifera TaxID=50390 RepID=A0ABM5IUA9_DIAVI|nr:probable phenylalanine--tRNA ligase, mitochondrial [Diabrotica virgifera virgifera]
MLNISSISLIKQTHFKLFKRLLSKAQLKTNDLILLNQNYLKDEYTNITDKVSGYIGRNIYLQPSNPLNLVRQRLVNYFYKKYVNRRGNPIFSIHDNLPPIVNVTQNFDSLLIPKDHPSRNKSDCYYINKKFLLRAHMTAHQSELIQSGLNNFLIIGDVYRRDEIDRTHYPVFHQVDAVRLRSRNQIFSDDNLNIFEEGTNTAFTGNQEKQACHSLEAVKVVEFELKDTLVGLAKALFKENTKYRWVDTTFPFTQPSWELEVFHNDEWIEVLGCGIMQQAILNNAGVHDKIGWAFGLGLERIAMCLYQIPDIRLFWSSDSGFLNQFKNKNVNDDIIYTPISQYPQCKNDLSFWLPPGEFSANDFYDLARNIGGDLIEQIELIDEFKHPKTGKVSHCYRITYRHMEKTLTQEEVSVIHKSIADAVKELGATIR